MIVAVSISGLASENIKSAAKAYIQSKLIMRPESIDRALDIPDYIFWAPTFYLDALLFPVLVFTVTPINIITDFYINISGGKLEIPLGNDSYKIVPAGGYLLSSEITSNDAQLIVNEFQAERELFKTDPNTFINDFNTDFNNDFF